MMVPLHTLPGLFVSSNFFSGQPLTDSLKTADTACFSGKPEELLVMNFISNPPSPYANGFIQKMVY